MRISFQLSACTITLVSLLASPLPSNASDNRTIEGEPKSITVDRIGRGLRSETLVEARVVANRYQVTTRYISETVDVPFQECVEKEGSGDGDWKGAFEFDRFQKPARLADAIKGLEIQTATHMVNQGYFEVQPRTWTEFCAEISKADMQIQNGLTKEITVKHGDENKKNLGFTSEKQCETRYRRDTVLKPTVKKEFYDAKTLNFRVFIEKGHLLNGEREYFRMTYDGFKPSLRIDSNFNTYTILPPHEEGNQVIYDVLGSRRHVSPINSLSILASNNSGEMALKITDTAFDPELGKDAGEAIAEVTLYQYRWLGFFNKSLGTIQISLSKNNRETIANSHMRPEPGSHVYAYYKLKRVDSSYYSNNPSESKSTSWVKF